MDLVGLRGSDRLEERAATRDRNFIRLFRDQSALAPTRSPRWRVA